MVCRPDGDNDSAEAWQTATAAEASLAAAVLVSNAAAMPAATKSAANGRPDGDDDSAAIAMQ